MLFLPVRKRHASYNYVQLVPRYQLLPINLAKIHTFDSTLCWCGRGERALPPLPEVLLARALCCRAHTAVSIRLCCTSLQSTITEAQPLDQQTHLCEYFLQIHLLMHSDSQHCYCQKKKKNKETNYQMSINRKQEISYF